jgi:hypothetical protein
VNAETMEKRIKALESQVREQQKQLQNYRDIEDIKRLQRAYGYYIENWMSQELVDCFADGPDVSLEIALGNFIGKESVKRFFNTYLDQKKNQDPEFLHMVMQLSGIVDVEPDGDKANGRWYAWGAIALPRKDGTHQAYMAGIYTALYVKQNGKWKIKNLRFHPKISSFPSKGWVNPDKVAADDARSRRVPPILPDIPRAYDTKYPSGFISPFHFKHPVTGKETSDKKRNAARFKGIKIE